MNVIDYFPLIFVYLSTKYADNDSIFTAGSHNLHCIVMMFPFSSLKSNDGEHIFFTSGHDEELAM